MSYLLDTNTCIAIINNRPTSARRKLADALAEQAAIAISTVAAFELWFGVAGNDPSRRLANESRLHEFLAGPLDLLPFEPGDARIAGEIRASLRAAGTPIGAYDVLIAGQALARGLSVVTSNLREFRRVAGLVCIDWCAG